jgi:hypothetical protein
VVLSQLIPATPELVALPATVLVLVGYVVLALVVGAVRQMVRAVKNTIFAVFTAHRTDIILTMAATMYIVPMDKVKRHGL